MSTDGTQGERQMVRIALQHITSPPPLDVLIGGLGVGYSLREVLEDERVHNVDVVELEKKVIEWNNLYFGEFNDHATSDQRVDVSCDDVLRHVGAASQQYDVIALDIDNGPDWLVRKQNQKAYHPAGLSAMKSALAPGGVMAVWSVTKNESFRRRLKDIFRHSFVRRLDLEDERSRKYHIYLYFGCKTGLSPAP